MEYIFEIIDKKTGTSADVSTRIESCLGEFNKRFSFADHYITVKKEGDVYPLKIESEADLLVFQDDLLAFQTAFERRIWKDKQEHVLDSLVLAETDGFHVKGSDKPIPGAGMTLGELKVKAVGRNTGRSISQAVDPAHYQGYLSGEGIPELQWLEAKQYQRPWRDPDAFIAAVLLQADKYLSRLGGKDEEVQEILKGIWYLKFVAAFIANGKKPIRVKDIDKLLSIAKK
jgi:hypothetical protein